MLSMDLQVEPSRGWEVGCWDPELRVTWPSVSCHMNNSEGMLVVNANSIPEGPRPFIFIKVSTCRSVGPGSLS